MSGKRGRKRKQWEEYEESADGNRLRCKICAELHPAQPWIERSSASNHLKQAGHLENVKEVQRNRARDLATRAAADVQYAPAPEPSTRIPAHVREPSPARRSREFDANGVQIETQDFWHDESRQYEDTSDGEEENGNSHDPAADDRRQTLFEQALAELCIRNGLDHLEDEGLPYNASEELEDEDIDETEIQRELDAMSHPSSYSPYGSKLMFLLDLIDNIPRLRLSSAQLRIILWVLKEMGVAGVPSLYALREVQKKLTASVGVKTRHFRTSLGNVHSSNDLAGIIARDWANPELGPLLQVYPEEPSGPRSELWHFDRLKELDPSLLSPMYTKGDRHFYVNELAELSDGSFAIPHMWIIREKQVCADAYLVTRTENGFDVGTELKSIRARDLKRNYEQILRGETTIKFTGDSAAFVMPNPLRELAGGVPLYSSFIGLWSDDVSGNQSKQYNKHENICAQHLNVPGRALQQEYNVHLVSTSPHASSLEQFEAVHKMISESQRSPVTTLHVAKQSRYLCKIRLIPICLPADNPQQSVEASHIGPGGNHQCRSCDVGGTGRETETEHGYKSLFHESTPRTREAVRTEIEAQLRAAMTGVETTVANLQTASGIKDRIAQHWIRQMITLARQYKTGPVKLKDDEIVDRLSSWLAEQTDKPYNVLLNMDGLDPTEDTPVEILHTVLLGVMKYSWHGFHSQWKTGAGETFVARLQSTDTAGLNIPTIQAPYIVQYRNNLIGRHFKALMQTMAFHVHDIAPDESFHLIKCIGELGAVLWMVEIDDLEQYLRDVQILIDNVLDAFVAIEPRKIIVKQKLHVLLHLVRDIRRFGPAFRFATEVFECFNAVFRSSSILSNRQAPSRDIARKMASLERVKHIASGGFWSTSPDWENFAQAGDGIRVYLETHPIILKHLGWTRPGSIPLGQVRLPGQHKRQTVAWASTESSQHGESGTNGGEAVQWTHAVTVAIVSKDRCSVNSWVCFAKNGTDSIFGRITEIVSFGSVARICVERYRLGQTRHPRFGMPTLARCSPREHLVIDPKDALFCLNVQHDCFSAKCSTQNVDTSVMQERQEVIKQLLKLTHVDDGHFVINTHALHNSHLLRRALPRDLTAPRHAERDRVAFHAAIAEEVRALHAAAKVAQQEKAATAQAAVDAPVASVPTGDQGTDNRASAAAGSSERPNESLDRVGSS